MRKPGGWVGSTVVLLLLLANVPASAQFASSIEGTVTDQSGAIVPGATVTITNEATGATHSVATTSAGYYRIPALPGGLYTVKVSLSGFKTVVHERIRVESARTQTINPVLQVGQTLEEVTVTGQTPLVETSQGRVSGLIEGRQVDDLPLMGRNFFSLVVLTPGVVGRATGGGQAYAQSNSDLYNNEFGVNMNANGARAESNNFLVDSSTVSSSQRSGVVNINPNSESVQEVRVAVNNFSAEYGRNGSVLVNVITKSGSNSLSGSFGTYYTNDSMQAKNHFQKQAAGFRHPDFGRTEVSWGLGGPIRREKTFFFTSGDVLRSDVAVSGARSVLTPEFIRFMEQARPNNVSTYIAKNYPASFAPDRNFRTAGQHLGSSCTGGTLIDSPVGPVPCNLPVSGEGTWNETSPRNGLQWMARVDHQFSGNDRIYGSFNRTTTDKVGFGTPEVYPGFTAASPTSSMQFNTNWTRVISPTTVNEATFSWVRPWGELLNPRPDIPGVTVTGISTYQVGWGPNEFVQNSFEWRDVLTMTRGSQTLKIGGAYTREHADNEASRVFNRPTYGFNSVFDFAADQAFRQDQIAIDPATGNAITEIIRFHRTQSISAFVQDDWKVRPNLSINLGLRYEGYMNIYDAAGDMANIEFTTDSGDLRSRVATSRVVLRHYYLEGGLFGGGMHTLAPRASFAWDPSNEGKMSVRGGIGRAYERMSNQIWDGEYQNLPAFATLSVTTQGAVKPVFGLGQNTTVPYNYPRPAGLTSGLNSQGGLLNGTALVHVVDSDIEPMYLDNWFVGVQRSLTSQIVVEANYIGSRGRNAYFKWDVNRFNGDLFDGTLTRIVPGYAAMNYTDSTDESSFHGGTVAAKVMKRDLMFGGSYTFGRSRDFSSTFSPPQRPDAYGPADQDEGRSDFDVPHKVSLWGIWNIPGPESAGVAKALLSGWQVSGVMIAQSGVPFTVICEGVAFRPIPDASGAIVGNSGCDYNADGAGNDRPNIPAFGASLSGLSNDDFLAGIFKASDFPTPAPGVQGTLGRNTYRGPDYFNVDFLVSRSIRLPSLAGNPSNLQIRFEFFNLFNTTNLAPPQRNITSPQFGRSTEALPGRIFQLAGRFTF